MPQSKRLGQGMQQGPKSRSHPVWASSGLSTGGGSRRTSFSQTMVSTLKQAQINASEDTILRQVWISLGEAVAHTAPCFDLQCERNGCRVDAWFRFGILHSSVCTSAQHLFTPLECEFYE